eukprot:12613-Heterococcus_DN1.PRE.2
MRYALSLPESLSVSSSVKAGSVRVLSAAAMRSFRECGNCLNLGTSKPQPRLPIACCSSADNVTQFELQQLHGGRADVSNNVAALCSSQQQCLYAHYLTGLYCHYLYWALPSLQHSLIVVVVVVIVDGCDVGVCACSDGQCEQQQRVLAVVRAAIV